MQGENIRVEQFQLGELYSREEMAVVGQVAVPQGSRDPHWSTGIIRFDNAILLLVTLEKTHFDYVDYFDGSLFWWQSQNQQTQSSPVVTKIASGEVPAFLFARLRSKSQGTTDRFVYCGRLSIPDLEGERPVTALFGLLDYVPGATGELAELYAWRPASLGSTTEAVRQKAIRVRQSRGQGRQLDAKLRREVELHAMRRAIEHYRLAGWTVTDTSSKLPFDLLCERAGEIRRVEVKGTQSAGTEVLVTIGEVNAARSDGVPTDLFVLHTIAVSRSDAGYSPAGGNLRLVEGWIPSDVDLSPTAFSCRVAS